MSLKEPQIIEFIRKNEKMTLDEIKKALRKKYPNEKFYSEDVENYVIKAMAKDREERER